MLSTIVQKARLNCSPCKGEVPSLLGGEGISFHYLCKSVMNIASPNEKKRYLSSTAFL